MPDEGPYETTLPCRDAVGRQRQLRIAQTSVGEVSIMAPPGGTAIVTADQIEGVRQALDEARTRITRGGSP